MRTGPVFYVFLLNCHLTHQVTHAGILQEIVEPMGKKCLISCCGGRINRGSFEISVQNGLFCLDSFLYGEVCSSKACQGGVIST